MINILVADDHPVIRQGITRILEETPDISVSAEADSGSAVLEKVMQSNFDLILLDISMPNRDGMDIIKELKIIRPNIPVLVLTVHSEIGYAMRMLEAGASGYLTKDKAPSELINAIRTVARGGTYVDSSIGGSLFFGYGLNQGKPLHENLSHRQYQIMLKIAQGKNTVDIARELILSPKTVLVHRSNILQKMKMKNNADIIHYAIQNKLLD